MRNLSVLINQARRATENVEFSDTEGLQNSEFIQYANDAQDEVEAQASIVNADAFMTSGTIQCVAGQEDYSIPSDALLGTKISQVLWAPNGSASSYLRLQQGRMSEITATYPGTPSYFVRIGRTLKLVPAPQSSSSVIKVFYQQSLPQLELQSGKVGTVSLTSNGITSLVLDDTFANDVSALTEEGYITIVDSDGVIKMKDIPVSAIDENTLIVTVAPGFTFDAGETITVGDFVLRGPRSTTHSQLPDNCERFLLSYMQWRILKRDSSNDATEQEGEMKMHLQSIIDLLSEADTSVDGIPIINTEYLDLGDRM